MLSRARTSRGRPTNAPAAFIQPCRPTVAKQPARGDGWVHELKHDGYRAPRRTGAALMNGADWSERYPLIVKAAGRIKGSAIIDAEVACLDAEGVADFDALHSRTMDHAAIACAFDLLVHNEVNLRKRPLSERKATLRKALRAMKKVFSTSRMSKAMVPRCLT
jgi:bifunctional non-homologous end joining protein LigD